MKGRFYLEVRDKSGPGLVLQMARGSNQVFKKVATHAWNLNTKECKNSQQGGKK